MVNFNSSVQLTNAAHALVKFIKGPQGQWRGRIEIGPDPLNNVVMFTEYHSSRLEVIHAAERQVKEFTTPVDTSDLPTQPITPIVLGE